MIRFPGLHGKGSDAGCDTIHALAVPDDVSLVRVPPYAPDLHPILRTCLFRNECHLSHGLPHDHEAFVEAACRA